MYESNVDFLEIRHWSTTGKGQIWKCLLGAYEERKVHCCVETLVQIPAGQWPGREAVAARDRDSVTFETSPHPTTIWVVARRKENLPRFGVCRKRSVSSIAVICRNKTPLAADFV